jgi:hypothetical protein
MSGAYQYVFFRLVRHSLTQDCPCSGSAEEGREWALAGSRKDKRLGVKDFNDAADFLIKQGYTSPAQLAVFGAGFGATLVAAAVNCAPANTYKCVVLRRPMLDPVNTLNQREYFLAAADEAEKKKWFRAIRKQMKRVAAEFQLLSRDLKDLPETVVHFGNLQKRTKLGQLEKAWFVLTTRNLRFYKGPFHLIQTNRHFTWCLLTMVASFSFVSSTPECRARLR